MKASGVAFSALVAFGIGGTSIQPVRSAEGPACGKFRYYTEYLEVEYVDHGEPGVSVGDARYGYGRLSDVNGDEVARFYFHTVISPGGGGDSHVVQGSSYSEFPNGKIMTGSAIRIPDPVSVATHADEHNYAVVGGTGDFAGARGTLRAFNDEQGRRIAEFDIFCLD